MEQTCTKRIAWIDIAKCIAILSTVAGHTFPYESLTQTIAYSFHMPLFFVLSGFTFRPASSWRAMAACIKKDVLLLLVPCFATLAISVVLRFFLAPDVSPWTQIKDAGRALFWASGSEKPGIPELGMQWFLISLFWAKQLMHLIHLALPGKKWAYLIALLGASGIYIGAELFLPQNFDVTLVALLFLCLGMLWRRHEAAATRWTPLLLCIAVPVWIGGICERILFSMADRIYPGGILSVLYASCGVYVVCCLSKALSASRWLKAGMSLIGRHSLLFFCLHSIDFCAAPIWRNSYPPFALLLRLSLLFLCFLLILGWKRIRPAAKATRPPV